MHFNNLKGIVVAQFLKRSRSFLMQYHAILYYTIQATTSSSSQKTYQIAHFTNLFNEIVKVIYWMHEENH